MNEIIGKFKYLIEKAQYFQKLKDDEQFLFDEILKISHEDIRLVQRAYVNEEKIKKIRYKAANLILDYKFNQTSFDELKNEINNQYETNILNSWKNFSILYVFFFNPIKKQVDQFLDDIGNYLIEKSGKNLKLKTTNFDGAQNFGEVGCWLALYNPKYKSQSEGIQYFINFYHENTTYGTYKHEEKKDFNRKTYSISDLDENLIYQIIDDIKSQADLILENNSMEYKNMTINSQTQPLNQILYGPPGTGKTYKTIDKALEIIYGCKSEELKEKIENDNNLSDEIKNELDKRKQLKKTFDYYKDNAKQIVFTTFHQSFGYEEFVEGIKALEPDHEENQTDDLVYRTMPGIFKKLTTKAQLFDTEDEFRIEINTKVWKISLEGARENVTKKYCFENDLIRIGWDDYGDLNNTVKQLNTSLKYFYNVMTEGDLVISLYDAKHIDGIGIIVGDYFYDANLGEYCHCRKVKWFVKNKKMYFYDINDKRNLVQSTIYRLWHVNKNSLMELIASENKTFSSKKNEKNYVLIIDEINRGNISKIFGDLITLIEDSKRIGKSEEIKVALPYSGDDFGVPDNLYIIGTMNTADRSIALMDTALRRRFHFEEMMPDYVALKDVLGESIDLGSNKINPTELLETINKRIEYLYDRDHQIGHAYFMSLNGKSGNDALLELDNIFRNKIIPLLQEYFYDDWEKIQIVLGDHYDQINATKSSSGNDEKDFNSDGNKYKFIQSFKANEVSIIGFNHDNIEDEQRKYRIHPMKPFPVEAYIGIIDFAKKKPVSVKEENDSEQTNNY